jgi:D-alanine-D-alanine ligase
VWHDRGKVTPIERILRQLDIAFIGLHGEFGEDGEVQKILEKFGIPYTGADSLSSHFAMHKVLSKMKAREAGVLTPDFRYVERVEDAEAVVADVIRSFHQPVVVKPVSWGSSVGVSIVSGYGEVLGAVQSLFAEGSPGVLIEEYIKGREATAGVVEGLRGEKLYSLPTVEIVPPAGSFFSYDTKYSGETLEICPGRFSRVETEEIKRVAKVMHKALGLRHYSRSDFMVTRKGVYYLETNSLPGLTEHSLLPKALAAIGVPFPHFLSHLAMLALGKVVGTGTSNSK